MIEDIREALEDGARVDFDLVIIGGGPAGITLARELAGTGQRIALLEAGGLTHPDAEQLSLYEGQSTGLPYPIAASRQRFFGGTSNHWGGWCRPLDEVDFSNRSWMPGSGWPIERSQLMPFYRRAHDIVEVPSRDYDISDDVDEDVILPADRSSEFRNAGFRFSPPTRFGQRYRDELRGLEDLSVFLNATVTDLEHDQRRVTAARVQTLDGRNYEFRAGRFVLATGGLEVPRLLLHTAKNDAPALGNSSGLVGRYFMEHFGYTPGYLLTRAGLKYHRHPGRDAPLMPVLTPSVDLMRRLELNNCCLLFTAVEPDVDWPPEALATPGLAPRVPSGAWRYRITMINEPTPNADSRVSLGEERDALGMRKLKLHWAIADRDLKGIDRLVGRLSRWLGRSGLGRMQYSRPVSPETTRSFTGGMHHMGTARMSRAPEDGVVDPDCRVHGTDNLYVASSAVFPASGYSNPTLTIVALSLRLAHHLKGAQA
ncbi:MAG: GMC family oxidoreductase [Wenzhouxiangella sp.]|jgi:choline dehydrogenase-like flavoprotein|nr:GMC family oxidoreductase [Wenzhouxiangella sp.]